MADGQQRCTGVETDRLLLVNEVMKNATASDGGARAFYDKGGSCVQLLGNLVCANKGGGVPSTDDVLDMDTTMTEDCRKKRCVDRYDSSESSDSGVAILSCTDCSGSSTASSDITDPGSPFSTASSHSEDSAPQQPAAAAAKMPPTHNAHHHPPWLWTDEQPTLKRTTTSSNKAFGKRVKTDAAEPPKCLNNNSTSSSLNAQIVEPSLKKQKAVAVAVAAAVESKLQQGKITEYFKSQYKSTNVIKKELSNIVIKGNANKFIGLVDAKKAVSAAAKVPVERFQKTRSVPRKILPAPSRPIADKLINVPVGFPQSIITTLIPNVAYIQAPKKPPDNGIYVPQFAINDKLNAIPIRTGHPCINVLQPLQKIAAINNFNCVVPIVKLNMPSKGYHHHPPNHGAGNFIAAVPTVLTTSSAAKPKPEVASMPPVTTMTIADDDSSTPTIDVGSSSNDGVSGSGSSSSGEDSRCLVEELSRADSGVSSSGDGPLVVSVDECTASSDASKADEEQKSPILSQPKTIRFPVKERRHEKEKRGVGADAAMCQWDQCAAQFDTNGALLEHLQVKHVISQATQEQYVCLWQGCKVHGRKSCSRSWLERHVLAHAGSKPFRCIVDGCGQRFNSQLALERHVNGHFNTDSSQNGTTRKSVESGSTKLFRRNGKKIRFRRQPWSARMFDFMDSGIMEGLQYKLLSMTERRTMGRFESVDGDTVTLQSQVLARRVEQDGTRKVLLRWHPSEVVDDEWVNESDYERTKTLPIPKLEPSAKASLRPVLFPPIDGAGGGRTSKHRRKPSKMDGT